MMSRRTVYVLSYILYYGDGYYSTYCILVDRYKLQKYVLHKDTTNTVASTIEVETVLYTLSNQPISYLVTILLSWKSPVVVVGPLFPLQTL